MMAVPRMILFGIIVYQLQGTHSITLHTTEYSYKVLSDYGFNPRSSRSFIFQAKACSNIHVGLQTLYMSTNPMYEIVIGAVSNQYSILRRSAQGTTLVSNAGQRTDCNAFKTFWVSWTSAIEAGSGDTVGVNVFLSWTDSSPIRVNHVAVASWNDAPIDWIFGPNDNKLLFNLMTAGAQLSQNKQFSQKTASSSTCSMLCVSKCWCRVFSYSDNEGSCVLSDEVPEVGELQQIGGTKTWLITN